MPMSMTYPFHMDFSRYSITKLLKLAADDVSLSYLDRDDLLQLVDAMAEKLKEKEEDEEV
jgi:hypothetical protein